jgi:lipopolysaccharide/colanic/teichoic acid biosynthesis glycosyltransferase
MRRATALDREDRDLSVSGSPRDGQLIDVVEESTPRTPPAVRPAARSLRLLRRAALRDGVAVIGDSAEVGVAIDLFREHPEIGRVREAVAYPGKATGASREDEERRSEDEAVRAGGEAGAAVIVVPGMSSAAVNSLLARLHALGVTTYLHTGVTRTAPARMRTVALPHQVLHQLVPPSHSALQRRAKRGIDVVAGAVLLLLSAPLIAIAAIAIKLGDGGPVLFRQDRVGADGRTFVILKLRTMVVDADQLVLDLRDRNEREGPLFKLDRDPRETLAGRALRKYSIDELPQLVNVLRGDMSLVGPRPALPQETMAFDADLRRRTELRPGLTGPWQVLARDKPSHYLYRELDLYYVDNWTIAGDLVIVGRTATAVVRRAVRRPAR